MGTLECTYEVRCINCGWSPQHPSKPFSRQPVKTSTKKKKVHALPKPSYRVSPWLDQNTDLLGIRGISKARLALDRLDPPFMYKYTSEEVGETLLLKFPCFSEDPRYKREQGYLPKNERRGLWETWKKNRQKIEERIAPLPQEQRTTLWRVLRLLQERERQFAARTDCTIRWFLDIIKRERAGLRALRKATDRPILFRNSLTDSLLAHCDTVQGKLDYAEAIVNEACLLLKPARQFYLSQKAPSRKEAKEVILLALKSVQGYTQYKASRLTKELLELADPARPATPESLRQIFFKTE